MRAVLAASLVFIPAIALAQGASPNTDATLQMSRQQGHTVVRPGTPVETIEQDAAAAAAGIEQQRALDNARAVTRPPRRLPNTDYDVTSGIQSQRLNDALRRR